ncbi:RES family NAD+ phosphorylase [Acerihabitans sp. KWT182]|uniref:RES family NAD+ phosphorylase n=1 Tax=Acerihabitans sp. KWT182 TaxID=3157919 RepID=A0AAU7QAZ4_9GAMM
MAVKPGSLNDVVKKLASTTVSVLKNEQDKAAYVKIEQLRDELLHDCGSKVLAGTKAFRLQQGEYGGSNVFFNRDGQDYRYSLIDGVNGSMYLAYTPKTAMKEVFKNKKGLRESDLNDHFMGVVDIEKDVKVLQITALSSKSDVTTHDVTTPTRAVTHLLAQKVHSAGFDGMEFTSNVTGEPCLVLWHNDPAGAGIATTGAQTPLSKFTYRGQEAAVILVYELGIPVEE